MREVYGEPISGDPFTDRRRSGIGGSDAGAILGVSPYASKLSVWEEKRGLAPIRSIPSERMVWGTRLEAAVLEGYQEDTNRRLRRGGRAFRRHPVYRFVTGHPDAETFDGRLVEVKTTSSLADWGDDGSADIPAHYYAQVQHYLLLRSLPVADVAVLVNGREYHQYEVPADEDFQTAMLAEEEAFWRQVIDGEPPEPDGSESAGAALRRMFPHPVPDEIVATPEVAGYAAELLEARRRRDDADAVVERYTQLIQRYMGARERLVGPGFAASWSGRQGSVSWKGVVEDIRQALNVWTYERAGEEGMADLTRSIEGMIEARRGASSRVFTITRKS